MATDQNLKVLVTGAAGQIAYSLLPAIAKGDVFGPNQKVHLVLLDIPVMQGVLDGVGMELQDCSYPLLAEVTCTTDETTGFTGVDYAILVGAMPRREGMERKDLLAANVKIFKSQGKALDTVAKKTVKVVVVGNPANTNAFICKDNATTIPKENFTALTRLDQNRAQAQVAAKQGIAVSAVKNCIIWGNHSSTQFPDVAHATVEIKGEEQKVKDALKDDNWINNEFVKTVQVRGAAVIQARKLSSAMSAAKAIADHVHDWHFGVENGWVSMGVMSDGSYGVPPDIIYSFPVTINKQGQWKIVQGLSISDFAREMMDKTGKELVEEKTEALANTQD